MNYSTRYPIITSTERFNRGLLKAATTLIVVMALLLGLQFYRVSEANTILQRAVTTNVKKPASQGMSDLEKGLQSFLLEIGNKIESLERFFGLGV